MNGVVNIEDLRKLAKKRLPKIAYDFIEGGTDDEVGLVTNEQAFRKARIVPRYLVDITTREQSTTLFGRTYSSPIGIAPTGLAGLFRRGADLMLAEAARDANVPFIMSGSSTGSIEDLGKLAPDHGWYQLYSAKDQSVSEDMIKRAGDAGLRTLVFTVDVPEGSNRERNARNGWGRPLKLTWKTKFEALRHPPRHGRRHRAVHGRQVRVRRPPDALRRDRGRHTGRRQGAQHLQARDRHHHGADRRHQDRRSRPAI
ncbi:MAG TPA: alpha-hydroxy acid oxidase, partial [Reyranella sp.]|nr:alpha-hydroxy acid oxidase [Reyranella sp.]